MENKLTPQWAWAEYVPDAKNPWDLKKVGHLYRRAAFGANYAELQSGVKKTPRAAIDELFKGERATAGYDAETDGYLSAAAKKFNTGQQASGWWLYRMLYGPRPLQEKITLFWHNHFATSNAKVNNAGYMIGQYELMNRNALGNFAEMLQAISKDPAMMIWLDTVQSKKGMPNENYARELMELFSLGIGNYTEADIREAARALTGWEVKNGKFFYNKSQFDASEKKVFGKQGNFTGEDIVKMCLEKPACATFIVRKLFRFLISETIEATDSLIEPLTKSFAKTFDIKQLVETMLRSNLFFSEEAYRSKIKSPVDYVLGMARGLEATMGTLNSSVNLTETLVTLGQNVFHPPSVKGWDGGQTWLNGQTLLSRHNFALEMCRRPGAYRKPATARQLLDKNRQSEPKVIVAFLLDTFLQGDVPAESKQRLEKYVSEPSSFVYPSYWSKDDRLDQQMVSIVHSVLTLPEYQLD